MISRILGYVRDILIAVFLGTSLFADAFFVAFRLPNTFRRLFAEGTFNAAFIPSYAGALAKNKKRADTYLDNGFGALIGFEINGGSETGKKFIDSGVNIVFGHSAHHIVKTPVIQYNNGIIIYGLGDFINDYSVKESYQSDKALLCIVHKKYNKLSFELIPVQRKFVEEGGSIPFLTKS